ncbi:MAG: AmmeMemoRadiSam system radical SAM enzyme [Acidobacteria bacterium]|nr:AmmeMemoRadiSam system radical SAM enzyme [Acidobacteriota bacterium]
MKEAYLYEKLPEGGVRCQLCSHYCRIQPNRRGICHVRECRGDRLVTLVYDRVVSMQGDPIEKKPFFHFLPGTDSLSIATVGCNFRCEFCQNYSISQYPQEHNDIPGTPVTPEEIVDIAAARGFRSISYTYTEPTVFFELAYDTGVLARRRGLRNNFVSNGFMTPRAIEKMSDFLDAANIDLKSFSDEFYRKYCGGRLEPVLDSIRRLHEAGIWLEVTTLVIPGLNSEADELHRLAAFLADVDPRIPWHVSAFHPDYHMTDRPRTSIRHLEQAVTAGQEAGLRYIYFGNTPGHRSESTFCPHCGQLLVERRGFAVIKNRLVKPVCPDCRGEIDIILD